LFSDDHCSKWGVDQGGGRSSVGSSRSQWLSNSFGTGTLCSKSSREIPAKVRPRTILKKDQLLAYGSRDLVRGHDLGQQITNTLRMHSPTPS
jgi:hypothetical protein